MLSFCGYDITACGGCYLHLDHAVCQFPTKAHELPRGALGAKRASTPDSAALRLARNPIP